jgi:hypothetical protein
MFAVDPIMFKSSITGLIKTTSVEPPNLDTFPSPSPSP